MTEVLFALPAGIATALFCLYGPARIGLPVRPICTIYPLFSYAVWSAICAALLILVCDDIVRFATAWCFGTILFAGASIDMHYFLLPDEGALCLLFGGLLRIAGMPQEAMMMFIQAMTTGAFLLMLRRLSGNGLGWGDIKWMSAGALWLTPAGVVIGTAGAFLLGALWGLTRLRKTSVLPFGPCIAIAYAAAFLFGDIIYAWYEARFFGVSVY